MSYSLPPSPPIFVCFIEVLVAVVNLTAVVHWKNNCVAQTLSVMVQLRFELLAEHDDAVRDRLGPRLHSPIVEATQGGANLANSAHIDLHPPERLFRIDAVEDANHVHGSEGNQVWRV